MNRMISPTVANRRRPWLSSALLLALGLVLALPSAAFAQERRTSRNTGSAYQGPDVTVPENTRLPAKFSLRPWMSRVQDQERRGTCVAFVLTAYLEFLYQRNLSEQYAYYVAEQADGNDSPGLAGVEAVQVVCDKGTVDESLWAYNGAKIPDGGRIDGGPVPDSITDSTRRYKLSKFRFIADANVEAMRYAVAVLHRPVVVSVPIDWECGWRDGDINMPRAGFQGTSAESEADLENQVQGVAHAVMVVGYLHDQKRFIIRNSWGEDTAYAGYYTIPYDYVTRFTRYIFICDAENASVRVDDAKGTTDDYRYVELSRYAAGAGKYQFREDLVVGPKQSLSVPPGSTLTFAAGTGVECYGTINCKGTAEKPIRFNGTNWHGVRVGTRRGNATLAYCVIEGGTSTDTDDNGGGGCLRVSGGAKLVATDCTFRGGKADKGGGIYSLGGLSKETHEHYTSNIVLDHCAITGCVADAGGAIHCNSGTSVTATDTLFADNTARAGGAIILIGGGGDSGRVPGTFIRCAFRGNQASGDGGAVNVNGVSSGSFDACIFEGNQAGDDGGAIMGVASKESTSPLEVKNGCRFVGNRAGGDGGAIRLARGMKATLVSARFEANAATKNSGAIDMGGTDDQRAEATMTGCDLANNIADGSGGHMRVGANSWLTLDTCNFDGGLAKGNSGAIHVNGSAGHHAILKASDCAFRGMRATSGGAVNVNWFAQAEFARCTFANTESERSGGAIWATGRADAVCHLTLNNCQFVQIRCGSGGAISSDKGTDLRMEDCRFETCVSESSGAAVNISGDETAESTGRLHGCSFRECNSARSGGAVAVNAGATAMFTSCTFTSNRSSNSGGAAYVSGTGADRLAKGIFRDCTFTANSASGANYSGGALYVGTFVSAQFDRCEFTENTSANAGGAMFLVGHATKATEVVFNDCRIASNRATKAAGGALVNRRVSVRYTRCTFEGNRSGRNDGNAILAVADAENPALVISDQSTYDSDDAIVTGENVTLRR